MEPNEIRLYEGGDPVTVNIYPTIPIVCKSEDECEIEVAIAQQNTEIMLSQCSVKFGPNHPTSHQIVLYPKEDFLIDGEKSLILRKLLHNVKNVKNWKCYEDSQVAKVNTIPPFQVGIRFLGSFVWNCFELLQWTYW